MFRLQTGTREMFMNANKTLTILVAVLAMGAFAGLAVGLASDSDAADSYGSPTNIEIAPGMRYTYTPTWPADLTPTLAIELQKSGSTTGSDVSIASITSGKTLVVTIPTSADVGTVYHVVLKATTTNPVQTAYIYITFTVVDNLAVSGSHPNIVVGGAVSMTPSVDSGMGEVTWGVTVGHELPDGLQLNSATGKVTGVVETTGACTIYLTATTEYGETADLVVTFQVYSSLQPTNSPTNGVIIYVIG